MFEWGKVEREFKLKNVSKENKEGNKMKIRGLLAVGLLLAGSSCVAAGPEGTKKNIVVRTVKGTYNSASNGVTGAWGYAKDNKVRTAVGLSGAGLIFVKRDAIIGAGVELKDTVLGMDRGKQGALLLLGAAGYAACKANRNSQAALAEIKAIREELTTIGGKVDDLTVIVGNINSVSADDLATALNANEIRTRTIFAALKAQNPKGTKKIFAAAEEQLATMGKSSADLSGDEVN